MWGCSRLLLVWSVILCITANSDALYCYVGKNYESCEGTHATCFTIMGPGDVKVGTGCIAGERVDTECINIQASRINPRPVETSFDSPLPWLKPTGSFFDRLDLNEGSLTRDFAAGHLRRLGMQEGKICLCATDGCNKESSVSSVKSPSVNDGHNGVSGFLPSVSLLLGVLCFLAWK